MRHGLARREAPPIWPTACREDPPLDDREITLTERPRGLRSTVGLWAFCGVLIFCVIAAGGLIVWVQHRTALADQRRSLLQLSQILAEDTSRTMSLVDLVLRDVQSQVLDLGINTEDQFRRELDEKAIYDTLQARGRDLPQASTVALFDATGKLVNFSLRFPPSDFDVHDRDYFQHFAAQDDRALYLGNVQPGRASGDPKFQAKQGDALYWFSSDANKQEFLKTVQMLVRM